MEFDQQGGVCYELINQGKAENDMETPNSIKDEQEEYDQVDQLQFKIRD